jgi:hypothetical protein
MNHCSARLRTLAIVLSAFLLGSEQSAWGTIIVGSFPIFTSGGPGGVGFGVTTYSGSTAGSPVFMAPSSSVTGLNDNVLTTPGGGLGTAAPSSATNVAPPTMSTSLSPNTPLVATQAATGSFGGGQVYIGGQEIFYQLADVSGAGHASYAISTWTANFVESPQFGAFSGNVGTYLSMGGLVGTVGSAAIVGLTTHVTSANSSSPFYGNNGSGITLNPLVLAVQNTSNGLSEVALGQGGAGMNAAFIFNGNNFLGLAYDSFPAVVQPGDSFTVTSTLTVYGDPAMISSFDPTLDPSLLSLTGPLPAFLLADAGPASVPEPSSLVLGGFAILIGAGYGCRRYLKSARRRPLA